MNNKKAFILKVGSLYLLIKSIFLFINYLLNYANNFLLQNKQNNLIKILFSKNFFHALFQEDRVIITFVLLIILIVISIIVFILVKVKEKNNSITIKKEHSLEHLTLGIIMFISAILEIPTIYSQYSEYKQLSEMYAYKNFSIIDFDYNNLIIVLIEFILYLLLGLLFIFIKTSKKVINEISE